LLQLEELFRITRFGIVRVETRRQESKDAMNRLGLGVGAYLEKFIVVRTLQYCGISGEMLFSIFTLAGKHDYSFQKDAFPSPKRRHGDDQK